MRACASFARRALHLTPELLHVAEHRGVLLSDALGDVEAGQDVVEALGAEDDLDRTLAVAVDVESAQTLRDALPRHAEALGRDDQVPRVRAQVGVELRELDVGEVVRLRRLLDAQVDLLHLGPDPLRLGALGVDGRIGTGSGDAHGKRRGESRKDEQRDPGLSRSRTVHGLCSTVRQATRWRRYPSRA